MRGEDRGVRLPREQEITLLVCRDTEKRTRIIWRSCLFLDVSHFSPCLCVSVLEAPLQLFHGISLFNQTQDPGLRRAVPAVRDKRSGHGPCV